MREDALRRLRSVTSRLRYRHVVAYPVVGLLLFGAGWLAHGLSQRSPAREADRRVVLKGFRFTSPLLDVELPPGVTAGHEPIPFLEKAKALVQAQASGNLARHIAVYYRDLREGPWFAINETIEFDPASMMKVPVMIAWLRRAEKDPEALGRSMNFSTATGVDVPPDARPDQSIVPGRCYTVGELLRYMMKHSDNRATSLLYHALGAAELSAVLDGMDVINVPRGDTNSTTVRGYSGFLRVLYNAAFLSREMSDRALHLMSEQDFPQGIVAGVPRGTVVASKFGQHVEANGEGTQLHEFGIVYHRTSPYILGVMTRGSDPGRQTRVIREVSRLVYTEVDAAARRLRTSR